MLGGMAGDGEAGRAAGVADVHALAAGMPHVRCVHGPKGNPVYQVGGKSFVYFRTPRGDAADPVTGERYDDVIIFWVGSDADKRSLVADPESPFFSTPHFDGHPSVLIRARDLPAITDGELSEIVADAWLSRASRARARAWLNSQGLEGGSR